MKKDNKSLLWGILAGTVVGSVTALLFAPKPGKELRKDIADGTADAIDKVQEIAGAASEKSTELYSKAKDAALTVVTEVKEWSKQYTGADEEEKAAVSGIVAEGESAEIIFDEAGEELDELVELDTLEDEADALAALEDDTENGKDGSDLA
ncbi:YtxH domain-containing protein [Paenibacillus sp. sgz5001063]|uniref:YtxH domain-containing protein n=1 Tax=Paenibacillus sp. sgz5001063 TaxID=3242474 RepID=UPI0036D20C7B